MWDHEAIHLWFGLSYSNYLVVPRSVLQSMPDEWQKRFVLMLKEMQEAYGHLDWPCYDVRALRDWPELIYPRVKCEDCNGTGIDPDDQEECQSASHFIEVTTLATTHPHGERHESMCDCGWRGPVRLFWADAYGDAERHRREVTDDA